jgi:hypothetical protein
MLPREVKLAKNQMQAFMQPRRHCGGDRLNHW